MVIFKCWQKPWLLIRYEFYLFNLQWKRQIVLHWWIHTLCPFHLFLNWSMKLDGFTILLDLFGSWFWVFIKQLHLSQQMLRFLCKIVGAQMWLDRMIYDIILYHYFICDEIYFLLFIKFNFLSISLLYLKCYHLLFFSFCSPGSWLVKEHVNGESQRA